MLVPAQEMVYCEAPLRTCGERQTIYVINGLHRPRCFELALGAADEGDVIVMMDAVNWSKPVIDMDKPLKGLEICGDDWVWEVPE